MPPPPPQVFEPPRTPPQPPPSRHGMRQAGDARRLVDTASDVLDAIPAADVDIVEVAAGGDPLGAGATVERIYREALGEYRQMRYGAGSLVPDDAAVRADAFADAGGAL